MGLGELLRFIQCLHFKLCVKCGLEIWGKLHYNVNRKRQGQYLKIQKKPARLSQSASEREGSMQGMVTYEERMEERRKRERSRIL